MMTHSEHGVEPEQYEPDLADKDQARDHILDFSMVVARISGQYVVIDDLALDLRVPLHISSIQADFHDVDGQNIPSFESIHHREETLVGVGDPTLGATWLAVPGASSPVTLEVGLGVTIPLGSTEPDPFELGRAEEPHSHVFFGSGTFDPIARIELRAPLDGWSPRLWSDARISLYENEHGYRGPTVVQAGLGALSSLGTDVWSFLVEVGLFHEEPARWSGRQAENSGRTEVLAAAAVAFRASPNWMVSTQARTPLYTQAVGGQLEMPLLVMVGATYTPTPDAP
jgi:hypothetical protein